MKNIFAPFCAEKRGTRIGPFVSSLFFRTLVVSVVLNFWLQDTQAAAILVTRTTGMVQVKKDGVANPVPDGAFPLLDGQVLFVPQGGTAVILSGGKAEQIVGPKEITTQVQVGTTDGVQHENALSSVLQRQNSASNVGATRSQSGIQFLRPIANTPILSLSNIQWQCYDCGEQEISLINMADFPTTIWTSKGTGSATYAGNPLPPGEYAFVITGDYVGFRVLSLVEKREIEEAVQQAKNMSKELSFVDKVAVEVGVWWQSGVATEAMYILDTAVSAHPQDQELLDMQKMYQGLLYQ